VENSGPRRGVFETGVFVGSVIGLGCEQKMTPQPIAFHDGPANPEASFPGALDLALQPGEGEEASQIAIEALIRGS
jgi:hypothetical protein